MVHLRDRRTRDNITAAMFIGVLQNATDGLVHFEKLAF
jgi:hypothetical protein